MRLCRPWGIIALWWVMRGHTGSGGGGVVHGAVVDNVVDNFLAQQWWWNLKDATPSTKRCTRLDAPWFPCINNTNNNSSSAVLVQTLSVVYPRTFGVVECGRAYTRAQTRWGPIVTWSAANASSWYTVLFIDTSDTAYVYTRARANRLVWCRFAVLIPFFRKLRYTVHTGRAPCWIQSTSHSALRSRQCTGHGVAKWLGYYQNGGHARAASH
jgi:hypothetical protein